MAKQLALMLGIGVIAALLMEFIDIVKHKTLLNRYEEYYNCTERLLDRLEGDFNWIDRSDNPAVDEYYNAREKLQKQLQE